MWVFAVMGGFIVLGVFLVGLERILSWMRSRLSQVGVLFVTMAERAGNNDLRLWQERFR